MRLEIEITDELLNAIADRVVSKLPAGKTEDDDDMLGGATEAEPPKLEAVQDAISQAIKRAGGDAAAKAKVKAVLAAHVPSGKDARAPEVPESSRAKCVEALGKVKK